MQKEMLQTLQQLIARDTGHAAAALNLIAGHVQPWTKHGHWALAEGIYTALAKTVPEKERRQAEFADILLPFVRSTDNRIRANAIKALFHLNHPDAHGHLVAMLREPSEAMRRSAAWLLGEVDLSEAHSLLEDLAASDPSEAVRTMARDALEKGRKQ